MHVYLVHLKTTGEVWHTAVCEDRDVAVQVMAGYGITRQLHASGPTAMSYECELWDKPSDPSQSASLVRRDVVCRR